MNLGGIKVYLNLVAHLAIGAAGFNNSSKLVGTIGEIEVRFCTEQLGKLNGNINGAVRELSKVAWSA